MARFHFTKQVYRFLITGTASTVLNYAAYSLLYLAGFSYLLAFTAGYIVGVLLGFIINKHWTFSSQGHYAKELPLYIGVYLVTMLLGMTILAVLVEAFGLLPLVANVFTLVITTASNFVLVKKIVFRGK